MSKSQQVSDAIVKQGMLPLYFNADETISIETLRALYSAGITALEYTNRGDAALANFKKMALDLPKAWQTISNEAIKQLALSNEETTLIQSMTEIFQKNCSAAISMT